MTFFFWSQKCQYFFIFCLNSKEVMITKNLVVKIQDCIVSHKMDVLDVKSFYLCCFSNAEIGNIISQKKRQNYK